MGEAKDMKKMSDEKRKSIIDDYFERFINETEEPRAYIRNGDGQFIAVGKLKEPTDHRGKGVNVATIQTGHIRDNNTVKDVRWDCRFDELKIFRNCCSKVIKEWK